MSVRVMAVVWEYDLPATEKLVLLVIADHADDWGENAYPGVARIAKRASITERHARRILHDLSDRGFLKIDRQMGGGKDLRDDRRPNRYRILGMTPVSSRGIDGGTRMSERPDTHVRHGGTPMSADTSIEPSKNYPSSDASSDWFDEFWESYPRKVGKRDASTVFRRLMRLGDSPSKDRVLGAVEALKAEGREMRFIPHPATWLRQGRWDDEIQVEESSPAIVEAKPLCGRCDRGWLVEVENGVERLGKCPCQL